MAWQYPSFSGRLQISTSTCIIAVDVIGIGFKSAFGDFKSPCFWHCSHFLTKSLISFEILYQKNLCAQFFHTLNFCLYEKPLPWNVQNSQCQNEHLLLFPFGDFCLWWRYVFCRINVHLWKSIFLSLFENWISNHNL